MSRFVAKCRFCDWTEKATGVYDTHYRAARHLKLAHPSDYAVMEAGENRIRQLASQLGQQFGAAAPMVRIV